MSPSLQPLPLQPRRATRLVAAVYKDTRFLTVTRAASSPSPRSRRGPRGPGSRAGQSERTSVADKLSIKAWGWGSAVGTLRVAGPVLDPAGSGEPKEATPRERAHHGGRDEVRKPGSAFTHGCQLAAADRLQFPRTRDRTPGPAAAEDSSPLAAARPGAALQGDLSQTARMCTKMEQPFYHDDSYAAAGYGRTPGSLSLHDYKLLKPTLALNLADPYRGLKGPGARGPGPEGSGAGSYFSGQGSDTGASLKLASTELERLIVPNSNGVITTTPTPPGQYFYPRGGGSGGGTGGGVTEEQEGFADGFVKALDDLHKMNHVTPPNVSLGASGGPQAGPGGVYAGPEPPPVYTNLSSYSPASASSGGAGAAVGTGSSYPTATISYLPHAPPFAGGHPAQLGLGRGASAFKEEPQTVPEARSRDATPPVSPINMEDQERIKVERKRLRNRLAATKCRKRKLERIARLEDKVKTLKAENAGLSSTAGLLREQVAQLKQKVMTHVSNGCQLLLGVKGHAF